MSSTTDDEIATHKEIKIIIELEDLVTGYTRASI